jgi:hypothetical protein
VDSRQETEEVSHSGFSYLAICALEKNYFQDAPACASPAPVGGGGACDASALPEQEKPDPDFVLKTGSRIVNGIRDPDRE